MKNIIRTGFALAFVCLIASTGLALTYSLTKDQIERQIREQQLKAAKKVLPMVEKTEDFKDLEDLVEKAKESVDIADKIFEGYKDGKVVGYAIQVLPKGYGGPVKTVVGLNLEGEVLAIEVVSHLETPGLGTEVIEGQFMEQFPGKTFEDIIELNKGIDGITGATKTSRAITKGIRAALDIYNGFIGD